MELVCRGAGKGAAMGPPAGPSPHGSFLLALAPALVDASPSSPACRARITAVLPRSPRARDGRRVELTLGKPSLASQSGLLGLPSRRSNLEN
ncbi:unnamed protein product [Urochloa humidicola]